MATEPIETVWYLTSAQWVAFTGLATAALALATVGWLGLLGIKLVQLGLRLPQLGLRLKELEPLRSSHDMTMIRYWTGPCAEWPVREIQSDYSAILWITGRILSRY